MDLIDKRVEYFYQVVSYGGVRAAADVLGVTPSSLSRQIANLEKSLGATLLERHTKGAIATPAGEELLACYRQMHEQEENFKQALHNLKGLNAGKVHISTGVGYLRYISDMVNNFTHDYPDIVIHISVHSSTEIIRKVLESETDIGLLYNSINHPRLRSHYKTTHELCVFMHPNHHLAHQDIIKLSDLSHQKIAFTDHTHGIRQVVAQAESDLGISLPTALLCNDMSLLKRYTQTGGVAILPEFMCYAEDIHLTTRPLSLPTQCHTDTQVITRHGKHLSIATKTVIDHLIQSLKRKP